MTTVSDVLHWAADQTTDQSIKRFLGKLASSVSTQVLHVQLDTHEVTRRPDGWYGTSCPRHGRAKTPSYDHALDLVRAHEHCRGVTQ